MSSHTGTLRIALSELALTDAIDGHLRRSAERLKRLKQVEQLESETPINTHRAAGAAWASAELARALIAQERGDHQTVARVSERITALRGRYEPWPLILIAEGGALRAAHGPVTALAHLRTAVAHAGGPRRLAHPWREYLAVFAASLDTAVGNLASAELQLTNSDLDPAVRRLERARLALFGSNDVEALLLAEGVGDPGATKRQRVDRRLLVATAAWSCGRTEEAFTSLHDAIALIERYGLTSLLFGVPHELLADLAVAARDARVCDVVALVDAVPEPARAWRYERLTEMELRTLEAIHRHGSAVGAAAELFVTAGTVKKHLAAVYRKLRVRDRDAAVIRASDMGLIDVAHPRG